jgi:hypothetical protein
MSFIMSVCLSAQNNSARTGRIFIKLSSEIFFLNLSQKFKFLPKTDTHTHTHNRHTDETPVQMERNHVTAASNNCCKFNILSVELSRTVKLCVLTERNETQLQTSNKRNAFKHHGLQYSCTLLLLKMEAECFFETQVNIYQVT